jgi:hypothetical protein
MSSNRHNATPRNRTELPAYRGNQRAPEQIPDQRAEARHDRRSLDRAMTRVTIGCNVLGMSEGVPCVCSRLRRRAGIDISTAFKALATRRNYSAGRVAGKRFSLIDRRYSHLDKGSRAAQDNPGQRPGCAGPADPSNNGV